MKRMEVTPSGGVVTLAGLGSWPAAAAVYAVDVESSGGGAMNGGGAMSVGGAMNGGGAMNVGVESSVGGASSGLIRNSTDAMDISDENGAGASASNWGGSNNDGGSSSNNASDIGAGVNSDHMGSSSADSSSASGSGESSSSSSSSNDINAARMKKGIKPASQSLPPEPPSQLHLHLHQPPVLIGVGVSQLPISHSQLPPSQMSDHLLMPPPLPTANQIYNMSHGNNLM